MNATLTRVSETVKTPHLVIEDGNFRSTSVANWPSVEGTAGHPAGLSIAYTPGVARVSQAIAADATLA